MQFDQAIQCNEKILSIAREISDQHKEANAYQILGVICVRQSQHERAIDYFTQALTIYRNIGERDKEAMNLGNLGAVYFSLRQLDKAIECIQEEVDIFEEIGYFGLDDAQKILADYKKIANKKWWQFWV
jgi:tetratricopeptide (TPR) repeat protein